MNEDYCGQCGLESLTCMNRERMDGCRCCKACDGHSIPVSAAGYGSMADNGHPTGDGITLLQMLVQMQRAGR